MTAAPRAAVARAKAGNDDFSCGEMVDAAFLIGEASDLAYAHAGSSEKVIDVPMHFFRWRQMPADARLEIAQGTSRIDIAPRWKIEFAQPSHTHAKRRIHLDQQLVGYCRKIRTSHCRTGY